MTQPTIICLMGPTASGKTDLAVELVQNSQCEIISVDSAMIYRGMDIGTAKPTADILKIAPHRLLDIRDPRDAYSAGDFRKDALREIENILQQKKIPLLVGGTMLYFNALQNGIADLPRADANIRAAIDREASEIGWQKLHERLQKIDPVAAERIHPNDPQRLQRALEIHMITGKTLTQICAEQAQQQLPYQVINFAIAPTDRALLHQKIAQRFQHMLENNFLQEVEKLFARDDLHENLPSIRAVGYRQAWQYLKGEIDYTSMQEKAIAATRQLAKRQLTWLRSWRDLQWLESGEKNNLEKILHATKNVPIFKR